MASQPRTRTKAVETVTVGCKLANGFIMQVDNTTLTINGFNKSTVIGSHGITEKVPKDFWEAWLAENKDRKLCTGGFVFAHESAKSTAAEAKEKSDNNSGTEPLDPKDKSTGVEEVD
ncbi:hypothetical protein [Acinetobacter larvae]|uniref:Uncharacterized protein n=1 Tax=Acinetobacter larvae TaxID=1789224 RepID=A0A1B2LZF7_9GAMM|nr:hypothetical protein [Acinetobacter larvae]AOA58324.1 hypothetical protein BFG52_08120 [Acinetobacter larvae]